MNLYIEGAKVLNKVKQKRSAIKTLVYSSQYQNKKQLLALVCETLRYGSVLSPIVENLKLLKTERLLKNDDCLAQALLYDFTIGKGLVKAGKLKQTMTRHKTEIQEEVKKTLEDAGVSNVTDLLPEELQSNILPRYVRVNTIKTTVESVIMTLEAEEWEYVASPATHMKRFRKTIRDLEKYQFTRDLHLPDVLVFPSGTDFHDNQLFMSGEIILQDKASCFPAHILNPPEGAVVVDSCAAPGNKTSHLASLMKNHGKIFAIDKDGRRAATLQSLLQNAGVTCDITKCMDFLRVNPKESTYQDVEYVLVDPSCSGSGIVSRMDQFTDDDDSKTTDRLESLARFQSLILEQALRFPNAKKIVYSTCSIHSQENEEVVENVYLKVKDKFKFANIMPDWPVRGEEGYEHAHCFIRMSPENSLTNGFFIACFEKLDDLDADVGVATNDILADDSLNFDKDGSKKSKKKCKKHKNSEFEGENNISDQRLADDTFDLDTHCSKKIKKKSKKHKNSEHENNNHDVMDSSENSHDQQTPKKKKKKRGDNLELNENISSEDLNEVKSISEVDEYTPRKKSKKSKHKKDKDNESKISNTENDSLTLETRSKQKKHKRKHKEEDIAISSEEHLPHESKISNAEQDNFDSDHSSSETQPKQKKHKRKHKEEDSAILSDEHLPHKKHKKKHKNKQ